MINIRYWGNQAYLLCSLISEYCVRGSGDPFRAKRTTTHICIYSSEIAWGFTYKEIFRYHPSLQYQ